MRVLYTPAQLIAFEEQIADDFRQKRILAPIHLAGGNEQQLISIFQHHIEPDDWIMCSWRSHYHCLLKGIPPEQLRTAIIAGHSIALCFPNFNILSSGIVGGTAPIAVGLALGFKLRNERRKVVCFLGDMSAETGIVHESMKYAINNNLPIVWVIEDNGQSVLTETVKAWGGLTEFPASVIRYSYKLTRPHCGIDCWVNF